MLSSSFEIGLGKGKIKGPNKPNRYGIVNRIAGYTLDRDSHLRLLTPFNSYMQCELISLYRIDSYNAYRLLYDFNNRANKA